MLEAARRATLDDVVALDRLERGVVDEQEDQRGGKSWLLREGLRRTSWPMLFESADHLVLVGTIDDVVVGFAVAAVEVLADETRLVRIDNMFVEADARAVSVGEHLLGAVEVWAREVGAEAIDACALPGARTTKNFFEGHGFSARLLVMHRRLDPSEEGSGAS